MTKAHLGWRAGERFWQCTEHVFSGRRDDMRGHQCGKTATKDQDMNGNPTKCVVHSQDGKAKRSAKREADYQAYRARMNQADTKFALGKEAHSIIRRIADGHNDPRSLCLDWVARWKANE